MQLLHCCSVLNILAWFSLKHNVIIWCRLFEQFNNVYDQFSNQIIAGQPGIFSNFSHRSNAKFAAGVKDRKKVFDRPIDQLFSLLYSITHGTSLNLSGSSPIPLDRTSFRIFIGIQISICLKSDKNQPSTLKTDFFLSEKI